MVNKIYVCILLIIFCIFAFSIPVLATYDITMYEDIVLHLDDRLSNRYIIVTFDGDFWTLVKSDTPFYVSTNGYLCGTCVSFRSARDRNFLETSFPDNFFDGSITTSVYSNKSIFNNQLYFSTQAVLDTTGKTIFPAMGKLPFNNPSFITTEEELMTANFDYLKIDAR